MSLLMKNVAGLLNRTRYNVYLRRMLDKTGTN